MSATLTEAYVRAPMVVRVPPVQLVTHAVESLPRKWVLRVAYVSCGDCSAHDLADDSDDAVVVAAAADVADAAAAVALCE